jgi:hypothetical protein
MFLDIASWMSKHNKPSDEIFNYNGPQHFSNYAHPYFPPGIAFCIERGGLIKLFLVRRFYWCYYDI